MQHRILACLVAAAAALCDLRAQDVERIYALRIGGRLVGHTTETESAVREDGRDVLRYSTRTLVKVELLGADVDQRIDQVWILDPQTREVLRLESTIRTGAAEVELAGRRTAAGFELDGSADPIDPGAVVIAPDMRWLRGRELGDEPLEVDTLVPEAAGVQRMTVRRAAPFERTIDALGAPTQVFVYEVDLPQLGVRSRAFVRRDDHVIVRYELPAQDLVMEPMAPGLAERIQRVDLTDSILVRTNLTVDDPAALTFVEVRAVVDATDDVTVASLNVPGQSFEGTVTDGRVEGVFRIRPRRIAGAGAPAFPVPDGAFAAPELAPYLAPSENIESDDPPIVAKAAELADGARTCFEVVERLSRWAYDEIPYEIPGGGTAKRTFALRAGDCGGHSRVLAAMLRSLGIPARTPMGGMYVPLYGGSFAQHMWTEVWLGDEIGWLPVDCTADQPTFIDAGHVRLSTELTRFLPKEVEVLDYEPKAAGRPEPGPDRRADAMPYAVDETVAYAWSVGGKPLGEESFTYRGARDGAHVFEGRVELAGGRFVERTTTRVGDDGALRSFRAERKAGDVEETVVVTVQDGQARFTKKSTEGDKEDEVAVDPSVLPLHNNCTLHFALAVERVGPLVEGARHRVRLFHSEQRSAFAMTIAVGGVEEVEVDGEEVRARVVDVDLVGLEVRLHVDDRGRLLRYHQAQRDVVIERRRPK